jgi:replicative DNA helicase
MSIDSELGAFGYLCSSQCSEEYWHHLLDSVSHTHLSKEMLPFYQCLQHILPEEGGISNFSAIAAISEKEGINVNWSIMGQLIDKGAPTESQAKHCIESIKKTYQQSMIASNLIDIVKGRNKKPIDQWIEDSSDRVHALFHIEKEDKPESIYEILADVIDNPHGERYITTGYSDIDKIISGYREKDFVVLAGRPSMGKTALAICSAVNTAYRQSSVLIISLEMSKRQIANRMLSVDSHVTQKSFKYNQGKVLAAFKRLSGLCIYTWSPPSATLANIRTKAISHKRKHGLNLIIVDYMQLLRAPRDYASKEQEVSDISKGLKSLARELSTCVMGVSQLNRECEKRPDKRPVLSDLRDSGQVEQDADVVMFVYRDELYNPEAQKGLTELIVAKQREGPLGVVPLVYRHNVTRFDGIAEGM